MENFKIALVFATLIAILVTVVSRIMDNNFYIYFDTIVFTSIIFYHVRKWWLRF